LYHVVSSKLSARELLFKGKIETLLGSKVKVRFNEKGEVVLNDTVKIVKRDIQASNGIVHVIDAVLIPPKSILEIASSDPRFTTLVSAVQSAGLVETLSGKGPFTVFAPTNDAFAKLSAIPSGDVLKQVLLYHVAAGDFDTKDLLWKGMVNTVQGKDVHVEFKSGALVLNGKVKVIVSNLEASNGIVHVIDTVLIPPR
jgi:transforming growth factor-beta-induced protein